ncbi:MULTISPECIES: UbiA family prenyltransferase [Burkholderia]|uniref:UbiA family prenyltransferase n=1 Tax=Burkholderia TaxID=32008 RepID=UPI0005549214|nr:MULTISPECIES: UbiA family prenyltransferase [Burkholderia]TCT31979.1 4-hydroxybenzoate polyprenyltransferase [Burkholderia vietnamiensis]SCZ28082.1 4-hydroxybenzoate polyprenyltransferase [Burkholderia vietnamiensis]SFX62415.1 4-hydroxybenzoate polyprenyltransferase [Burkholderia vietnamiensis]HDR9081988.1 UbiA family prenyltransferase [Burkholderia vietnamiensis]
MTNKPLVVDLDGTLIRSDVLLESGFAFVKQSPHKFYQPLLWLMKDGKAGLKARLAEQVQLDVSSLPYDPVIVEWLQDEHANGRQIVLATATHEHFAKQIAEHIGIFERTFATRDGINLSSSNKRDALIREYGEKGFDYAGNSHDDIRVWRASDQAFVVNPDKGVARVAEKEGNVARVIDTRRSSLKVLSKALRTHQWLKNVLVFLPILAAHQFLSIPHVVHALIAFVAFSLCASSVYLLNDLLDLEDDRHHPTKRFRPLASGALSLTVGIALFPVILATSFGLSLLLLPPQFTLVLIGYYALTLAYSMYLKRRVMVDVVSLAALYTIRIIAGSAATGVAPSFWLLAFSMFMFLSLALVKRYAELYSMQARGVEKSRGRGYVADDLPLISSLGAAAGYLAALVLALYIQDTNTMYLYSHPKWLWIGCPLILYWVSRTWIIAHRGLMHDDPIVFAARDRTSLIVAVMFAAVCWIAA